MRLVVAVIAVAAVSIPIASPMLPLPAQAGLTLFALDSLTALSLKPFASLALLSLPENALPKLSLFTLTSLPLDALPLPS